MRHVLRFVVAAALMLSATYMGAERRSDAPRYPDVWEWFVPVESGAELKDLVGWLLDRGDVAVIADLIDAAGKPIKKSWLLFSGDSLDARSFAAAQDHIVGVTRLESGIGEGFTVTSLSHRYRLCYRGPVRSEIIKRDDSIHFAARRVAFVLLDRPREFVGGGGQRWFGEENASCPDEGPVHIKYRVASVEGVFLALPDGTTLLFDANVGLILRLKDTLEPGAPSPSKRVFMFDVPDDDRLVEGLLGKGYQNDDEDTPRYQEALDDLYLYLTQLGRDPKLCEEFRAQSNTRQRLAEYALEGDESEDGSELVSRVDLDSDGVDDVVTRFCPGSGSIVRPDPCTLRFTASSTQKSFQLEEQGLYAFKYRRGVYVVAGSVTSETSPMLVDIYALSGDGASKICSFEIEQGR